MLRRDVPKHITIRDVYVDIHNIKLVNFDNKPELDDMKKKEEMVSVQKRVVNELGELLQNSKAFCNSKDSSKFTLKIDILDLSIGDRWQRFTGFGTGFVKLELGYTLLGDNDTTIYKHGKIRYVDPLSSTPKSKKTFNERCGKDSGVNALVGILPTIVECIYVTGRNPQLLHSYHSIISSFHFHY